MDVAIELKGVEEALQTLNRVAKDGPAASLRALRAIGILVQREAKKNAPKSPSASLLNKARKTKGRRGWKKGKDGRLFKIAKDRTVYRPSPGGLERSIEREVTSDSARIFVASNSAAGKYAGRIHDAKGKSWRNRGPGTIAKGARADDKFIKRAIVDNEGKILDIIKAEHRRAGWYEL